MTDIVLFGGTIEGRLIAEKFAVEFAGTQTRLCVSVATKYGASLVQETPNVYVHAGTMDYKQIKEFLEAEGVTLCVDATHPYAAVVTENIVGACDELGIAYVRVARGEAEVQDASSNGDLSKSTNEYSKVNGKAQRYHETVSCENTGASCGEPEVYTVDSVAEAADFLDTTEGRIFITTGSKELECYKKIRNYKTRCIARVLSTLPVMIKCSGIGFEGKNLIAMQGPFSEAMNYEMFVSNNIKWVVTKSSGKAGGFEEKCEAALRAGARLVIIGRPKDAGKNFVGIEESLEIMKRAYT